MIASVLRVETKANHGDQEPKRHSARANSSSRLTTEAGRPARALQGWVRRSFPERADGGRFLKMRAV
jgi:hypothetical protein